MATHSGTSRVIDTLQSDIDALRGELTETRAALAESKQKCSILTKRNETMVEQLSNAKHQAEVAESLLKRKERRVLDLETQVTELGSTSDAYRFELDSIKSKLHSFENDNSRYASENDRLTKSYDMLQSSFHDYRLQMSKTVADLKQQIPEFINSQSTKLQSNLSLLQNSQPSILANFNQLSKNSKRLEELYSQKYDKVNEYLQLLTTSTRQHGQATSIVMEECEDILKKINRNEDLVLKVKSDTTGPLTDSDKLNEYSKLRDLSILQSAATSATPSTTPSPIASPSLMGKKNFDKRVSSLSTHLPDSMESTSSASNTNTNTNTTTKKKRQSLNFNNGSNSAGQRRNRNTSNNYNHNNHHNNHNHNNHHNNHYNNRQSLNQDDFANMSFEDYKKRISSAGSTDSSLNNNSNNGNLSRSSSVKRGYRRSRNFSPNNASTTHSRS